MERPNKCDKCKDTGRIKEKDGTIHTCFDCLVSGRLDMHDKEIKDWGIKI